MGNKRRWAPRLDPAVEARIREYILDPRNNGLSAPAILDKLSTDPEFAERLAAANKSISERTIRDRINRLRPPDTSGPWSMADADPEDAALVLPVLAEAIEWSGGHSRRFSKAVARWIVKVRVAAPDLPVSWALNVAEAYRAAEERSDGEELESLDQMLAFAPWRDSYYYRRYQQAFNMLYPEQWFHFEVTANGEHSFAVSGSPGAEGVIIASACWSRQKENQLLVARALRDIRAEEEHHEEPTRER